MDELPSSPSALAARIEHTALKADTTLAQVENLCREAVEYGFYGVCVPPYFVRTAYTCLKGTGRKVITVVGFPMGYHTVPVKAAEAKKAISDGADELDMVINMAAWKSGRSAAVRDEVNALATVCRLQGRVLKVILETAYLDAAEIAALCEICAEEQVAFVKTSTGFGPGGADVETVRLMRSLLPAGIGIKAAGGIRDADFARALIQAGADRLGASAGLAILQQL